MHQLIPLCDSITATVETRATGLIRMSLTHPSFDLQRADMTASQALALSRALLLAHDVRVGVDGFAFTSKDAGEGAQGGHPQRLTDEVPVKDMTTDQCLVYMLKHSAKGTQRGRMDWHVLIMLGALTSFWAAVAMGIHSALQAGQVL